MMPDLATLESPLHICHHLQTKISKITMADSKKFNPMKKTSEITSSSTQSLAPTLTLSHYLLATVAMSLGWGLRGTIGGGEVGAMIPGAMLGLVFAGFARLDSLQSSLITAACALGFGLGGAETYGQTIGLLKNPQTTAWGLLGLSLKGASWGIGASFFVWLAFHFGQYRQKNLLIAFALFIGGTLAGWWFINHPKLIYFSDRINKPREEVWFGLIFGPLIAMAYLSIAFRTIRPLKYAISGFLIGALGFGLGSLWFCIGFALPPEWRTGPWWKLMEFSFGAILGVGFTKTFLPILQNSFLPAHQLQYSKFSFKNFISGFFISTLAIEIQFSLPHRMPFLFLGVALFWLAWHFPQLAWHIALTVTTIGFLRDVTEDYSLSLSNEMLVATILLRNLTVALLVEWLTTFRTVNNKALLLYLGWAGYLAWLVRDLILGHIALGLVPVIFTLEIFLLSYLAFNKSDEMQLLSAESSANK